MKISELCSSILVLKLSSGIEALVPPLSSFEVYDDMNSGFELKGH
jgi:hypothetical protein